VPFERKGGTGWADHAWHEDRYSAVFAALQLEISIEDVCLEFVVWPRGRGCGWVGVMSGVTHAVLPITKSLFTSILVQYKSALQTLILKINLF